MPENVTELSQITPFNLTSLEDCTEESVYAPGHIQPHGIVFLLQGTDLKILQVSENVEEFFGMAAEELLGQPLQRLFSKAQVEKIVSYLTKKTLNIQNYLELKIHR